MDTKALDILKWVGVAIVAGFLGYLGRYLAMLILEKMHKRKAQTTAMEATRETATTQANHLEESRLKLEKKRAKQAAKKAKKEQKK